MSQPLSRTHSAPPHDRRTAPAEEAAPVPCIEPVPRAAAAAASAADLRSGGRAGLFEHFVCRVGGMPVDVVEELRPAGLAAALDDAAAAEAAMAAEVEVLADALYESVGATDQRRRRHRLLQLRRDVHNLRRPRRADVAAGRQVLEPEVSAALDRYAAAATRREDRRSALPGLHEEGLRHARERFRRAVTDADFRKGLLLSSRILSEELDRYLATPPERLTAKERQIERGLLRYLTRMAMKTTPFGAFTAVLPGRFEAETAAAGVPEFRGDPSRKRSLVRLNKRLFGVLVRELFRDPEVRRHLGVELNPTLRREPGEDGQDRWSFLTGAGARETFQRLAASPVLDLYQEILAAGPRPLGEVEDRLLADDRIDAGRDDVESFTARLLEVGLLRLRTGIPAQEAEWDRPLRAALAAVPGEAASGAVTLLDRLRAVCDGFATAAVERRRALLAEATEAMRSSSQVLETRARHFEDLPLYEDCGAAAELPVPAGALSQACSRLVDLVRLTAPLAWPRHQQVAMRDFFDREYGAEPVPLLRFYEDYYRQHFKGFLEREQKLQRYRQGQAAARRGDDAGAEDLPEDFEAELDAGFDADNPFGLDVVARLNDVRKQLGDELRRAWRRDPAAETLELSRRSLERAVGTLPPVTAPCLSTSVFVQMLPGSGPGGGTALLLSPLLRGYGKYFSRFLAVLPPQVREDLYARNAEPRGALLADIGADGDFNANLHPPLVPWEVAYPTAEGGAAEGELRVTELVVEAAPGDPYALLLRHVPSGRPVVPLDLGFQNPKMRPPLYQLLSALAPGSNVFIQLPESLEDPAQGEREPRVELRPRVVYDGWLVLDRRRWSVPQALFPLPGGAESDAAYALRLDGWRRGHGLPREVFVSVRDAVAGGGAPRGDLHKPQYVDFANPLLVELLGRTLDSLRHFRLEVYERLPRRSQLPGHGNRRFATELVLQVDFPRGLHAADRGDRDG